MNYDKALIKLNALNNLGTRLGLNSMRQLMAVLNDVQDSLEIVHVGGTNGKGSIICYLEAIAMQEGVKCGAYTSPALIDFKENIRVNGEIIDEAAAVKLLSKIFDACDKIVQGGSVHPTRFEVETALAFLHFYNEGCKIVFLEVGLGGALDATNIIKSPRLIVFASMGIDHIKEFGDSIETVTRAECGILKEGSTVICGMKNKDAAPIVRDLVAKRGCILKAAAYYALPLRCAANWAGINAATARTAAEVLGYSASSINRGLALADWFGRYSIVSEHPTVILDGAHNVPAMQRLMASLVSNYPSSKFIFIVGIAKDKQAKQMLAVIAPLASKIITLGDSINCRLYKATELAQIVAADATAASIVAATSYAQAAKLAQEGSLENDVIIACGSLSILKGVEGAMKKLFMLKS